MIALSIALNDLLYIRFNVAVLPFLSSKPHTVSDEPRFVGFGMARGSAELADRHLFSLYFMLPLIGICFGLLKHNWYIHDCSIKSTFDTVSQVSSSCFHRRHILLFLRHGVCSRRHPRTLQQDTAPLFHSSNRQFRIFLSPIVRAYTMS